MRYARLDRHNRVREFVELTQEEFDARPILDKAELYEADDPTITEEYIFEDRWYSPEEIRDREFTNNPSQYKLVRTEAINEYRSRRFLHGFTYEGKQYKGDIPDQLWANAYLQALQTGMRMPPVYWISKDNSVTVFETEAEFQAMTQHFFDWSQNITFEHLTLKQQIRDAVTRADVDAVYDTFVQQMVSEGIEEVEL